MKLKAGLAFVISVAVSCTISYLAEAQLTHVFESRSLIFILSAFIGLTNGAGVFVFYMRRNEALAMKFRIKTLYVKLLQTPKLFKFQTVYVIQRKKWIFWKNLRVSRDRHSFHYQIGKASICLNRPACEEALSFLLQTRQLGN